MEYRVTTSCSSTFSVLYLHNVMVVSLNHHAGYSDPREHVPSSVSADVQVEGPVQPSGKRER